MKLLSHEETVDLAKRMGDAYLYGYRLGHAGKPSRAVERAQEPDMQPFIDAHLMGYSAGLNDALIEALK